MKNLILLLMLFCIAFQVNAQRLIWNDANITYDKGFVDGENHWVIMPRSNTSEAYPFGFLYIDPEVGFVFQQAGVFKIDNQKKYLLDEASTKVLYPRKMLSPGRFVSSITIWRFALVSDEHFNELNIKQSEPDWVKPYYTYTDTLAYNYSQACIYANSRYIETAIDYLQKIYKVNPHYIGSKQKVDFGYYLGSPGVELKLAWAYNSIDQPDKAIEILKSAIAFDLKNPFFYIVLGFSYDQKENWETAIDTYRHGLQLMGKEKSELKSNFAYGISNDYHALKNDDERKNWRAKGDEYNPCPGCVY
ncbi:hypothetical protein FO440_08000 [Mucilaginibacter corticis]|uniref:Uncharacterized protein n=1 Tax=Mucilaginibacter corticis TaxID=2597670 RepID=A0A556MW60_9SPHI|nr:hypothetical protein [Mucilaginibacter corticis]TSJ44105.1 hypothetical protein FO440_08000 [Mucilaginibacter corticis]